MITVPMKATFKQRGKQPFEGVDRSEAGRLGGLASGESRRRRSLEAKLLSTSGMGAYALYRTRISDVEARERAVRLREVEADERERKAGDRVRELDQMCERLDDWNEAGKLRAKRLRDLEDGLEVRVAELQRVEAELRATVAAEADAAGFELTDDEPEGDDATAA